MAIVAGFDEAGYGPHLGPLLVTGVAFEIPRTGVDLWDVFSASVAKLPCRGRPIAVCDSKKIYSPSCGIGRLEVAVLSILRAGFGREIADFSSLLNLLGCDGAARELLPPWYFDAEVRLPVKCYDEDIAAGTKLMRKAFDESGIRPVWARSRFVEAREFNEGVGRLGNKSDFLFECLASLLKDLLNARLPKVPGRASLPASREGDSNVIIGSTGASPSQVSVDVRVKDESPSCGGIEIFAGKQGGRKRYADGLNAALAGADVKVISEEQAKSVYSLEGFGGAKLSMLRDGEDAHFCIALASMICKYVREVAMTRMNSYWRERVPGLKATAGYGTDGRRFLDEIAPRRAELGIAREAVERMR
jgi:ribonuclease HII